MNIAVWFRFQKVHLNKPLGYRQDRGGDVWLYCSAARLVVSSISAQKLHTNCEARLCRGDNLGLFCSHGTLNTLQRETTNSFAHYSTQRGNLSDGESMAKIMSCIRTMIPSTGANQQTERVGEKKWKKKKGQGIVRACGDRWSAVHERMTAHLNELKQKVSQKSSATTRETDNVIQKTKQKHYFMLVLLKGVPQAFESWCMYT